MEKAIVNKIEKTRIPPEDAMPGKLYYLACYWCDFNKKNQFWDGFEQAVITKGIDPAKPISLKSINEYQIIDFDAPIMFINQYDENDFFILYKDKICFLCSSEGWLLENPLPKELR